MLCVTALLKWISISQPPKQYPSLFSCPFPLSRLSTENLPDKVCLNSHTFLLLILGSPALLKLNMPPSTPPTHSCPVPLFQASGPQSFQFWQLSVLKSSVPHTGSGSFPPRFELACSILPSRNPVLVAMPILFPKTQSHKYTISDFCIPSDLRELSLVI